MSDEPAMLDQSLGAAAFVHADIPLLDWVDADDDHVLINTEVHRAKFKAVERDPRVTVTILGASLRQACSA